MSNTHYQPPFRRPLRGHPFIKTTAAIVTGAICSHVIHAVPPKTEDLHAHQEVHIELRSPNMFPNAPVGMTTGTGIYHANSDITDHEGGVFEIGDFIERV